MSEAKARLIVEGKFRAYGTNNKKGWYTSTKTGQQCFFKSSWEEAIMKHLDACPEVERWDYESVRIPYTYDNHKRWYVPDFIVTFNDGTRDMYEVKPEHLLQTERVQRTTAAGEAYCRENGFRQYLIVTKQILTDWGIVM